MLLVMNSIGGSSVNRMYPQERSDGMRDRAVGGKNHRGSLHRYIRLEDNVR